MALFRADGFETPRPDGCLGVGNGLVEPAGPFTLIDGTEGVTDMEGAGALFLDAGDSLIEIEGIEGVTDIDGGFTLEPLSAELVEIVGVSEIEIVGMGGVVDGLESVGGV
jgi:hypothetical protein